MPPSSSPDRRWHRQWDLFHEALELDPSERKAFLAQAGGDDLELVAEVVALLEAHEDGPTVLDRPPPDAVAATVEDGGATRTTQTLAQQGLTPGQVLANRFEIGRLLGRGGMGAVYEATDRELGTRVALKILRPEIASSERAHARFRREITLARRVTHPNACRVFDLFQADGLAFLTMELLDGETLHARLARDGRLDLEEARLITEQIVAALEAVHREGVIHRDLKTSNVMLVADGESTRAVVTDFGLATSRHHDDSEETQLTRSGELLGTPAYMSPEQLENGAITEATDVYALGLTLYEMVTGKAPFIGDTPFSVAALRLAGTAPSPRREVPGLDRTWERTILRCLEKEPVDRFQTPREVLEALEGDRPPVVFSKRRHRMRQLVWALPAAILTSLAVTGLWLALVADPRGQALVAETLSFEERDAVLIGEFENQSGDPDFDGTLEAALTRELANSTFVTVASRLRIEDTLLLMKLPVDTPLTDETARELAVRDGGVRGILSGTVDRVGSSTILSADLIAPRDGAVVASLSEEIADGEEPIHALRRLSRGVRQLLGEELVSIEKSELELAKVSTPSLRALKLYSQADAMHIGRGQLAVKEQLLRDTIVEDPDFASAYLELAHVTTLSAMRGNETGGWAETHGLAKRAMELSDNTPDRERYYIRGRFYHLFFEEDGWPMDPKRLDRARANYEALLRLYPDHYDANLAMAGITSDGGENRLAGIPYTVRAAAQRPNDFESNFDVAHQLASWANRFDEAQPFVERAIQITAEEVHEWKGYEATWARFFAAHRAWMSGDVGGMREDLERAAERLQEAPPHVAGWTRSALQDGYRGLGLRSELSRLEMGGGSWLGVDAYFDGDDEAVLRHLGGAAHEDRGWSSFILHDPVRVAYLARSGFTDEARSVMAVFAAQEETPKPFFLNAGRSPKLIAKETLLPLMRAELALAEGRPEEAAALFEGQLLQDWYDVQWGYFVSLQGLAMAYEKLGQREAAVNILERSATEKHRAHPFGKEVWMANQVELARLYREQGWLDEAGQIAEELAVLMAAADADFWLVRKLAKL